MIGATQASIYARVSSERQAEENTIESQLAALYERVLADGLELLEELVFVDEGYSGSTLVRPALERLRDLVAMGGLDRGSTSTRLIGWRASTPTRSCSSTSSGGAASRWSS